MGNLGSIPGLGRSPGEGKGYLLQYSGLENSMACLVHGIPKSWTQLSDFHFLSINKDLLYSIANSTQYSVIAYMRKESKNNEYMYMLTESLCCTYETNTAL